MGYFLSCTLLYRLKNTSIPNELYIITGTIILSILYHMKIGIITDMDDNNSPINIVFIEFEEIIP